MVFEFRVIVSLDDEDESICVVGDCPELGDWNPEMGFELPPIPNERGLYGGVKDIGREEICYRYIVMSKNPKLPGLPCPDARDEEKKWRIQQIECHDYPRRRVRGSETPTDEFGTLDGLYRTDHGWITKDSVIQLKFFNDAVMIWNESYVGKKARIKLSSFVHHKGSVKSASVEPDRLRGYRTGSPLWYSDLNQDALVFQPQPEAGIDIGSEGNLCLTFQTALTHGISKLGFMVEVLFEQPGMNGDEGSTPLDRAFSLLLPSHLSKSCGVLTVPLCALDHELVGEVRVEHLVITPTQRSSHHFLSRLYSKNWKKSWVGLEIGHRGLGQSFAANLACRATIRENTIHSFVEAGKNGADMIELDVHLTADKVPVIYHDFQAPVRLASKKLKNGEMNTYDLLGQSNFMLAIRDRTFHELQDIIINNESDFERKMRESGGSDSDPLNDPFPSLKAVVENLDPSIGINVELKYPNHLSADSREFDRPFDMNEYVDTIVRTLEESPVERLIVLSCFNPDVCHALKLKQTAFPVLFLTQGVTTKWPPYMDPRTQSTEYAVRFAKATELMGVSCHAEEVLKSEALISRCLSAGLVMFIWGEDTNERSVIRRFKDLGVHGIIVDRLDALTEKVEKSSVLKRGSASL